MATTQKEMCEKPAAEVETNDQVEEAKTSLYEGTPVQEDKPTEETLLDEKTLLRNEELPMQDIFSQTYDIQRGDPFPEDLSIPPEHRQFTLRSVVVSSFLGAIVVSSNIYLGLKTGFMFGSQLFGSIFGYIILRCISRVMPSWLGGGFFGPKENCAVQSASTASGAMSSMFVTSIPAMYSLNLLGKSPEDDFWRLITFATVSAYYGTFFVIPLRKFYILYQRLVFPTSSACALTIRSLHSGVISRGVMKRKIWSLFISFIASLFLRVVSDYAPGIIWDWHIFWWLYKAGWKGAIAAENWGWWIEFTPAFFGIGFFTGINASFSFFFGMVLAWGIIGPIISRTGAAPHFIPLSNEHPEWRSYYSMNLQSSLNPKGFDPVTNSSPRYWLLWPGVMIMLCASFTEIFMNGKILLRGINQAFWTIYYKILRKPSSVFKDVIEDPAPPDSQIPLWLWLPLLFLSIICTCLVLRLQYGISIGLSLLSVLLGFVFSFIGAQSTGATDVNPISTCAKSSQLIFGAISTAQKMDEILAQRLNLLAGSVAASSASQSVDMIGDLKTGHLLGAKPKVQFYAQSVGSFFSIWLSVALYILFNRAYPCFTTQFMPDYPSTQRCVFGAPSVASWRAIAGAMTNPRLPISPLSGYVSIVFSAIAVIMIIFKYSICPRKYQVFIPNFNAIGLGFIVPQTYYATAMFIGAIVAYYWKKYRPISYDIYAFSIATGFAAGEGIGGVFNAIFQILSITGYKYGTSIGCPYDSWCN